MIIIYECAIQKIKLYINSVSAKERANLENYTAFDLSSMMEIITDKPKEEIIMDIIR